MILKTQTKSHYTVIELFAGCGGLALGLENAGLNSIALIEIDKAAVNTLRHNKPNWNVIHDDIKNMDFKHINADVVAGGFPCQAFSYAGNQLGFADIRGTLFFEFVRVIEEIKPKIILGENVKGLLNHDKGRTLSVMIKTLTDIGYNIEYRILKSQYLDVPQKRERLIIIGVRRDLSIPIIFPEHKNYTIPLKDALKDCPSSTGQLYSQNKKRFLELIPAGGCWRDLPENLQKEYMGKSYYSTGGRTGMARRLSWDDPSLTLTCSPNQKQTERCHPEETRPLQIREYARIQTFPDEWEFKGSISDQYKQIGNAVPVNLGFYIGTAIIQMLSKHDREISGVLF